MKIKFATDFEDGFVDKFCRPSLSLILFDTIAGLVESNVARIPIKNVIYIVALGAKAYLAIGFEETL